MDLRKFRAGLETEVFSKLNSLEKLNSILGTNSARIQHIINWAVRCLPEDEAYFEVGCLHGSSLAAACYGNDDKIKYAADVEIQGDLQYLIDTMPNLSFKLGNFFDMDLSSFLDLSIGVMYYDADHSYKATIDALEKITPYLADKAIIFMDDLEYGSVYNAWRAFMRKHPEQFTIVHEFWTPDKFVACTKGYEENFWDGFAIAEFEREFMEEDEDIANESVQIWHGLGKHQGRQGTLWPREFKHLHGKEESR